MSRSAPRHRAPTPSGSPAADALAAAYAAQNTRATSALPMRKRGERRTENERFLEALFRDAAPGTHTIVAAFRGDPGKVDRRAWAGRPWSPGQKLPPWFDGANCYLTVSTFDADPETGRRHRRKASFAAMHAVMVDDVGTKVDRKKLRLPPSALIETSPGNFQAFYFLKQNASTRDRLLCERLIDRMIAAGLTADGTDPGMRGVTRYGRLPVGINGKAKYVEKLGEPFQTRCVLLESWRRYSAQWIAKAWALDLSAPPPPRYTKKAAPSPALIERAGEQFAALLETLKIMEMYIGQRGAAHDITCPWIAEHTGKAASGTAIFEPSKDNGWAGGFVCHHGHCREHRTIRHVYAWLAELSRLAYRAACERKS